MILMGTSMVSGEDFPLNQSIEGSDQPKVNGAPANNGGS